MCSLLYLCVFDFNDTATTEIYTYCHTLSLHDALPICPQPRRLSACGVSFAGEGLDAGFGLFVCRPRFICEVVAAVRLLLGLPHPPLHGGEGRGEAIVVAACAVILAAPASAGVVFC